MIIVHTGKSLELWAFRYDISIDYTDEDLPQTKAPLYVSKLLSLTNPHTKNRGNRQNKIEKYREARSKRRALEKAKKLEILKNQPPGEVEPLKNEFKEVDYNIPPENPINAKVGNHQFLPFDNLINQDNFDEVLDLTSAFQELTTTTTTTNDIKVNDKVIREHSVKATETTKPFSQSQHLPNLATKNLKFNKGASKEEFQESLEKMVSKSGHIDLWLLQQCKQQEEYQLQSSKSHNLIKHAPEFWTGFLVSSSLPPTQSTTIDAEGRISLIKFGKQVIFNCIFAYNDVECEDLKPIISDNETLTKATENVHYRVIEAGDFNYNWSFEKNTIEEAEFIQTNERPPKPYELELMEFIGFVFEKFGLFNAFKVRYQNPGHLGYARRRLNGISVQRFDLNDFTYKLIKENDHLTAQHFEFLVRQENQELLGGKSESIGN